VRSVKEIVTVVSGLPRSGTSMMMRMLEAGGMEVLVDATRPPDEDNLNGYYEFEKVKQVKADSAWLDQAVGKAVKIISRLLYDLPQNRKYKIIFMMRSMTEILASQKVMLARGGNKGSDVADDAMERSFNTHLQRVTEWLARQTNLEVVYVGYNDMMEDPPTHAEIVNQFLGDGLDIQKMIGVVDRSLYRNRA